MLMMRVRFAPALALALISTALSPARASPADNLREMWSQFRFCLRSAPIDKGADLTLRFSFKRDGTLYGKPIVSYFNRPDDPEAERRNAAAIALAIDRCLPVQISESLGSAIAGRPMWIRIHGPKLANAT